MKILKALGSGFARSLKAWKGIIIVWFCFLVIVFLVVVPFKSSMNAGLGNSMITEKLKDGINIEVLGDLGKILSEMIRSLSLGMMFLVFMGILLNSFLSGGLLNSLKGQSGRFTAPEFFRTSAKYFWSFLGITLIISAILFVLGILIITVPLGIVSSNATTESAPYLAGIISGIIYFLALVIFLLVADYARAWQVKNEKPACFRALGFGFSRTFCKFLSSFPMMLVLIIIQILFSLLVIVVIGQWRPDTGGGVFLLFILSQIIVFVNLILKTWRYGSVTSLMEINDPVQSS
jgi:hypothetical protein